MEELDSWYVGHKSAMRESFWNAENCVDGKETANHTVPQFTVEDNVTC